MKQHVISIIGYILFTLTISNSAFANLATDLGRMIGFVIYDTATIEKVYTSDSDEKIVKLSTGKVFKVEFLLLDPLPLTDVIVFVKPPSKAIRDKFGGKVPEALLYEYKLLIDDEIFDATPSRL